MINIINNKQVMASLTTITVVILLLSTVSISSNFNFQNAAAQKTSGVETFSAKGYTGQTFVLPSGMMQTPASAATSQFNLLPL